MKGRKLATGGAAVLGGAFMSAVVTAAVFGAILFVPLVMWLLLSHATL
jgi:hypothetical protein